MHAAEAVATTQEFAVAEKQANAKDELRVPPLPISEEDKTRFLDALMQGKPYQETFTLLNGQLTATVRCKTRREDEFINAQIFRDTSVRRIRSQTDYTNAINYYSLAFQLVELQGQALPSIELPDNPYDPEFDFHAKFKEVVFFNAPEPMMFVLLTCLARFDRKALELAHKAATDPAFFDRAGASQSAKRP